MTMVSDLAEFIEAGSTLPGGFALKTTEIRLGDSFRESLCDETQDLEPLPEPFEEEVTAAAQRPLVRPLFGDQTMKLYQQHVQESVQRRLELEADAAAEEPQPRPVGRGDWKVTEEMMHQPWGAVLRAQHPLQPRSTAATNVARPAHAPAFLTGKSYVPQSVVAGCAHRLVSSL